MLPSKTHLAPVAWPRTDENEIGEPVHSNPSTGHQAGFCLVHLVHPLGSCALHELVHWSWRQTKRCRCSSVRDDAVLVCGMELFYQRRRHNTRKEETSTHVPAAGQQEARRPAGSQATTSTLTRVDHTHASTPNKHTHIHTHKHTHTHLNHQGVRRNVLVIQRSGSTRLRRGPSKPVLRTDVVACAGLTPVGGRRRS
jgi:hypothetical protein